MNDEDGPKIEVVEGAPDWMVTFGDLMALLLCFFVLLLSFSETDRAKYKEVAGSLEKAFGIQRETPSFDSPKGQSLIAKDFDKELRIITKKDQEITEAMDIEMDDMFNTKVKGIEVEAGDGKVTIRMLGETTFESGKAAIRPSMVDFLTKVGLLLKKTQGDVVIAGHTDDVPVKGGPHYSNLRLSLARSAAVAEFFINRRFLNPERVVTMGFGEYRPSDTNATAAGREKNRRVEIVLTPIPKMNKAAKIKPKAKS